MTLNLRTAGAGPLTLLFVCLACLGCGGGASASGSALESRGSDQPTIQISGLLAQVTRDGKVSEQFRAEWARLDEDDRILNLRNLELDFYKAGQPLGKAISGRGTLWMSDRPDQKIARNDLRLDETVTFQSKEGWLISSPRMQFRNLDAYLYSNDGFVKQMASKEGYIVGRGQRFEMQLAPEAGSFKYLNEFGNQLMYEVSDKPAVPTRRLESKRGPEAPPTTYLDEISSTVAQQTSVQPAVKP